MIDRGARGVLVLELIEELHVLGGMHLDVLDRVVLVALKGADVEQGARSPGAQLLEDAIIGDRQAHAFASLTDGVASGTNTSLSRHAG